MQNGWSSQRAISADYIIECVQRDFDGYFNNVAEDRFPFTSRAPTAKQYCCSECGLIRSS